MSATVVSLSLSRELAVLPCRLAGSLSSCDAVADLAECADDCSESEGRPRRKVASPPSFSMLTTRLMGEAALE